MNQEILLLAERMKDAWEGDPWYGRNTRTLLSEIDETIAFQQPSGQHSILELVWHMCTWKEFVISRIREDNKFPLKYFETADWRQLDHTNKALWKQGMQQLEQLQSEMVNLVLIQKDELLEKMVAERNYTFRKLLNGIIEHDVYHAGQVAYVKKLIVKK